jgi:hypothetical protein
MKRIAAVLSIMAVSTLFSAMSVIAADETPNKFGEEFGSVLSPPVKNECLLVARNCAAEPNTVQDRVNDLRREIGRGLDVYTPEELRIMEEQLKWIETDSNNMFM